MEYKAVVNLRIQKVGTTLVRLLVLGIVTACGQEVADADFRPPPELIREPERTQVVLPAAWAGALTPDARSLTSSPAEEVIASCRSRTIAPDPNGIIWIRFGKSESEPVFQNPFDARLALRRAHVETVVRFSGVVNGPNPVAIINGKAVVQGDRWTGFNIAAIARNVVLLEKNGAYVNVPRGRDITIRETF